MNRSEAMLLVLEAIKRLTLEEVRQALIDLDADRAALSLLYRILSARDKAKRKSKI